MRVHLCAVGRLRSGPERALVDDYLTRFDRTGRALGLGPFVQHEVEDKRNLGMAAEAELLTRVVPAGAVLVCLDERGRVMSSPDFAGQLAQWRDAGHQDVAFVVGGADGIAPASDLKSNLLGHMNRVYGKNVPTNADGGLKGDVGFIVD